MKTLIYQINRKKLYNLGPDYCVKAIQKHINLPTGLNPSQIVVRLDLARQCSEVFNQIRKDLEEKRRKLSK